MSDFFLTWAPEDFDREPEIELVRRFAQIEPYRAADPEMFEELLLNIAVDLRLAELFQELAQRIEARRSKATELPPQVRAAVERKMRGVETTQEEKDELFRVVSKQK